MPNERTFNFNEGCHVTFNDIHDNTNCSIYTAKQEPDDSEDVEMKNSPTSSTEASKFFRTDKCPLEECQKQLHEVIITSKNKQDALGQIRHVANSMYFNPNAFTHQALADELNQLQSLFNFTKADIDSSYSSKN